MKNNMVSGGGAVAVLLLAFTTPALAQRTDDNAVTEAEDAFGKSVGDEQIGIYNAYDVRGFSPVAAGNVRIEGLYFDQQGNVTDRIIAGSTVHVGISAQGYPFPAPTGIADFDLRKPGDKFVASVGFNAGPFSTLSGEVDLQIPVKGSELGITAGLGVYREENLTGTTPDLESMAVSVHYAPDKVTSIQPFWSRIAIRDEEAQPLYFTAGDYLPTPIKRGKFFGQKWADFAAELQTYGVVGKTQLLGFDAALGIFRADFDVKEDHADLLFDVDRTGAAGSRLIVGDVGNRFASTSGEFKLSRHFDDGKRRHFIHASVRGRALDRRYGGSALIDLGTSVAGAEDFRPQPVETYGAKSFEKVRQKTFGLGYELRWRGVGQANIGVQKTDYTKSVTTPAGPLPTSTDSPWLFSATAAAQLADNVALYGGYTRGLEESDSAPSNAINFNEAPPAIRTTQKDFGFRWGINKQVSMVLGYFDVEKPYFNLDAVSRYRELGAIRNRGLEFSLSGQIAKGLTVVAGTLYLDSSVKGEEVRRGLIGRRPVGWIKLRNIVNVNWKFPLHEPLTLTARFESASDRTANSANTFEVPDRWIMSLGARYRTKLGETPVLIRGTVDNVTNRFGWAVGGSGFFVPNGSRRVSLSVAADL